MGQELKMSIRGFIVATLSVGTVANFAFYPAVSLVILIGSMLGLAWYGLYRAFE
jgi:hypothetical protein